MSIVFSKTGMNDLTLERGRIFPYSDQKIEINQKRYLTESNNAKVINYGSNLKLINLSFTHLSIDNYTGTTNGLKTWFEDSNINWSANSFEMTDENGIIKTVRLWQDKFEMPRQVGGRHSISFILKVE